MTPHDALLQLTVLTLAAFTGVWSSPWHIENEVLVVDSGVNVSLTCSTTTDGLQVFWNKDGNVSSTSFWNHTGAILRLENVTNNDSGTYECRQKSLGHNNILKRVSLSVKYSPIIVNRDEVVSAVTGQDVHLFCEVNGFPVPNITWRRAHRQTRPPPIDNTVFLGSRLNISNVQKNDGGTYLCEAENGVGEKAQWNVLLRVKFSPEISLTKPQMSQAINYSVELQCVVDGVPSPNIQWFKDGREVLNDTMVAVSTSIRSSEVTGRLQMTSVRGTDFGNYTCRAENMLGVASEIIVLSESPFPVLPLIITDKEDGSDDKDASLYTSTFNVTGFILGMMPPLWISFYIILHLGFRSRYAEERPEEEGGDGLDEIVWEQGFRSKY